MEPILEDPIARGKYDECDWCEQLKEECACGDDSDGAYDRMMEQEAEWER